MTWFKVDREFLESSLWLSEPFTKPQAWIDLIGLANHSDGFFFIRGLKIELKRGQLGRSELTFSHRWKWSRDKVRRFFSYLRNEKMIITEQDNKTTIITICNYERFQGKNNSDDTANNTTDDTAEKQQKNSRKTPNDTQTRRIEEKKKDKKINTYSNEFESCFKIYPTRDGVRQGKKSASELFEKLPLEEKRKLFVGIKNYNMFLELPTTTQKAMDMERFIRKQFYNDYQEKVFYTEDKTRKNDFESSVNEILHGVI